MVEERGAIAAVEEYIFSLHSNFSDHDGEHPEHPAMLSRCLGLIFHALILIGYGIEFNIPGIVAEGTRVIFREIQSLTSFRSCTGRST